MRRSVQQYGFDRLVDPTHGPNPDGTTSTAACTKMSATDITGSCCSCNGLSKKYGKSAFSATIYSCT